jgi:hypothetical protein
MQFRVDSEQGQQHSTFYPIKKYPYIAIIDPLTGERVKQWNSALSPAEFIASSLDYINDPKPAPAKGKKRPKDVSMMTEEEQIELAIRASMGGPASKVEESDEEVEVIEPPLDNSPVGSNYFSHRVQENSTRLH